jgi:hypothetical protein
LFWSCQSAKGLKSVNAANDQNPAPRRFSLGDALILLIALSITLERFRSISWFRSFPSSLALAWHMFAQLMGWSPWTRFLAHTRQALMTELFALVIDSLLLRTLCPVLLGLMIAQPLLRLRRPRPPISEVVRQSGFAICIIGIALVCLLLSMGDWWFTGLALTLGMTRVIVLFMIWPLLGLRPWHTEPSWIDRLGRGVGLGWIMAIAVMAMLEHMGRT